MPATVEAELLLEDYRALARAGARRAAASLGPLRRAVASFYVLFGVALLALPRPLVVIEASGLWPLALLVAVLLAPALWLRVRTLQSATPDDLGLFLGPRRFTVDESGFTTEGPRSSTHVWWTGVRAVEETPEHAFVFVDRATGFVVPKRSFATPDHASRFVRELASRAAGRDTRVSAPAREAAVVVASGAALVALALAVRLLPEPEPHVPVEDELERAIDAEAEDVMYAQTARIDSQDEAIRTGRPGVEELYFVGFAGQADEDVFMKEAIYARDVFDRRFDTHGRSALLVNNAATVDEFPLASLTSLAWTLEDVGRKMDRDEDVLVLYLTSHGSADHILGVRYDPLPLPGVSPDEIAAALEEARIRWRVVVVSACYSGGFVPALANDRTMVLTAAAADRPSFGCGIHSELTHFGRAFLSDGLEETLDIVAAFEAAAAQVGDRERSEKLGASRPQIHAPAPLVEKLKRIEERLRSGGGGGTLSRRGRRPLTRPHAGLAARARTSRGPASPT